MTKQFFLLLFLFPVIVSAQDKVLFTNGIIKEGYILYQDNNWIYYGIKPRTKVNEEKLNRIENNYKTENEKVEADVKRTPVQKAAAINKVKINKVRSEAKVKYIKLERRAVDNVFSITHPDGKEEIIYSPDTLGFLVMDVVEPELDLTVDEMRRYIYGRQDGMKAKKTAVLLTSAGISFIGSGLGAFYGPIAPATYIIVLGTTRQKPNEKLVSHPEFIFDENYLEGYKKSARKRKIIAAAEGGLMGLAVGIVAYQTVFRGWTVK